MNDDTEDRRRHPRFPLNKKARAALNGKGIDGTVRDISSSGAGVDIDGWLDEDLELRLDIEDLGQFPGHVARAMDDFIGIEFDLDEGETEDLIASIRRDYGPSDEDF